MYDLNKYELTNEQSMTLFAYCRLNMEHCDVNVPA